MTRLYIGLLFVATFFTSATGVYFSVRGLMELFAGAAVPVAIMACSLEFSKFILVGVLYRYWGHIHATLRSYLVFAVCTLMLITSAGIYGYLSNAYQIASTELHTQLLAIDSLEKEGERIQTQLAEIKAFIDNIPASRIARKIEMQQDYEPKIAQLRERAEQVISERDLKKRELLKTNSKIGPAVHLAKLLGVDVDAAVNAVIIVFVLVFDPLAVSLVFCLNLILRLREKYRGDEYKIGARSLTSPVDHRIKKAA